MRATVTAGGRRSRGLPRSAAFAPAALVVALLLAVTGCEVFGGATTSAGGPAGPLPRQSRPPATVVAGARATKVLVVVEENRSYAQMRDKMPFLARLSNTYGYATHWRAIRHPSEPNYLAMVGGSTFGVTDDRSPRAHERQIGGAQSVFDLALRAGKTAAVYAEAMPGHCDASVRSARARTYTVHTNPWVYFPDGRAACRRYDRPLTSFGHRARTNTLPNVGFLIPDLVHDAHNGTLAVADRWLQTTLRPVLHSADFTTGRLVVIVTADEDDRRSGNTVLTSVLTPALRHKVVDVPLSHYSLTRYLCQVLGVPLLKNAATAPDLRSAFGL
jgi:hypothetical protein